MIHHNSTRSGFALLITLIVVSVIVAVTAAIIELSMKQLALSVTARDSEIAFHAANAGAECVRYIQRVSSTTLLTTSPISYNCFGAGAQNISTVTHNVTVSETLGANYAVRRYTNGTGITWNSDRCTQIDMLVINVSLNAPRDLVVSGLSGASAYPGYSANNGSKTCRVGSTCYVAQVTGYNNPCNNLGTADTVRREVLLEF
jgi:hypothetical protein